MGGAVLLSALAAPQPPAIDGAILVSPAVWSRADMPALYRVALFLVAHLDAGHHPDQQRRQPCGQRSCRPTISRC